MLPATITAPEPVWVPDVEVTFRLKHSEAANIDHSNLTLPRGTGLILQARPSRLLPRTLAMQVSYAQSRQKHGEPAHG